MNNPQLKPGVRSTEFIGKIVLQVVAALNAVLNLFDLPSLDLPAETTATVIAGTELIWMFWRQYNKRAELEAKRQVRLAELQLETLNKS